MRKVLPLVAIGIISGIVAASVTVAFFYSKRSTSSDSLMTAPTVIVPIRPLRMESGPGDASFVQAAQRATPSVVFIRAYGERTAGDDFWSYWGLWMPRTHQVYSAGSGVVWSADGYIVTNYHVVRDANRILVTFSDKRTLEAQLVGADAGVDIAVLKVKASALTPLPLANSDSIQIGEWVLAIGNPYNLTYTVTAGIISARGRNLNLLQGPLPLESFLQTDAAINPGNSGGALVNLRGELVGINTAIASRTGSYVGYGFAIPINIVRKAVEDLKGHGIVQRAFLDAEIVDLAEDRIGDISPEALQGLYIGRVYPGGAAEKAGLRSGDILIAIDGVNVHTQAEFLERLAQKRPGDRVKIFYRRNGKQYETTAILTNEDGEPTLLKREIYRSEALGADISPLSTRESQRLGISQGYRIQNLRSGIFSQMGLPEGFILLKINGYTPQSPREVEEILQKIRGRLTIEGIDAQGRRLYLNFSMR